MAGIFISYRRDDASGHAGRLFDRLAARFGREHVFMDVTDIAPGEDFTQVIETSLGSADLLLAVIGPQWLTASEPGGARRIDDPTDFVRQEIAAAFQRKVRVIPVLVRGARMPHADDLPDALKELPRRQAVELTDPRWDSDLALFEQALAERLSGSSSIRPATETGRKPGKALIVAALVVILMVAVAVFFRQEKTPPAENAAPDAAPADSAPRSGPREVDSDKAAASKTAYHSLALPKGARFRLAGQQFEILALRKETGDAGPDLLTVLLRMTNTGPYPAAFSDVSVLFESNGESTAPASPILEVIAGNSAEEGELQFPVARSTENAALSLRYRDEETRIPLALGEGAAFTPDGSVDAFGRARKPQLVDAIASFPVDLALPSPHSAQLGPGTFSISAIQLDGYNAERAVLGVQLQASAARDAAGGINFWSDNLRLSVDGVPHAPINSINELVAAGTTRTAKFEFLLTDVPQRLELTIRSGPWESGSLPIVIPGAK